MKSDNLWNDNAKAIEMQIESAKLKETLDEYDLMKSKFIDSKELLEMIKVDDIDQDLLIDLNQETTHLQPLVSSYFMKILMNQDSDKSSCFLELRAGAGGTESCDWVSSMTRMYTKWAAAKGYSCIL